MNEETLWDVMQAANVAHVSVSFSFDERRFGMSEDREKEVAKIQLSTLLANEIVYRILDVEGTKNYRKATDCRHELYTMFCDKERLHDLLTRAYNCGYAAGIQRMPSVTMRNLR